MTDQVFNVTPEILSYGSLELLVPLVVVALIVWLIVALVKRAGHNARP